MSERRASVNGPALHPLTGVDRLSRPPRRSGGVLTGLLLALLLTLLVVGGGALALQQHYAGRVSPGVWVAGIPLQGLTPDQARQALQDAWDSIGPRNLTLRDGEQSWVMPLSDLGISWDMPATVRAVMAVGHTGDFIQDWRARLQGLRRGVTVPAVWTVDEARTSAVLARIAAQIDRPARSATLTLTGAAPQSEPGASGRELDLEVTRQRLHQTLSEGLPQTLDLAVRTVPPTVVEGDAARQKAGAYLARKVILTFDEGGAHRSWALDRNVIQQALASRQEVGGDGQVHWAVDLKSEPLAAWIAGIARELDREKSEGRVRVDPNTLRASLSTPSQTGYKVDQAEALKRVLAALEKDPATVELPVLVSKPYTLAETVASWGKLNLLSEGTSNYATADAGKKKNVATGVSRFQGVVVPPGATFSFDSYLGPITLAEGWAEAYVILGDRTALGAGGGICQVATTCFRAAFFGGYPIVQRYAHTYRVTNYEPPAGLDATIFTPTVDMKFQNDLSFPIIIETFADPVSGLCRFRFYGPGELGRTVALEGPVESNYVKAPAPVYETDPNLAPGQVVMTEAAHDGIRITVYRIIKKGDQVVSREPFVSNYEPWPAHYKQGPTR